MFPFETSAQLVWSKSFLCSNVGLQVRCSWFEGESREAGETNDES
jgi:hypothetical protein